MRENVTFVYSVGKLMALFLLNDVTYLREVTMEPKSKNVILKKSLVTVLTTIVEISFQPSDNMKSITQKAWRTSYLQLWCYRRECQKFNQEKIV